MKLIVGLGNPGKEYADTRHNAGFWVVDRLAKECGADWGLDKHNESKFAKCRIGHANVILAKPQTFMNESGRAVALLSGYYKIQPQDILIVQDEMDLQPGTLALASGGRAAGHNGLSDIQNCFKGVDIQRLRLGIGKPTRTSERKDWVLGKPSADDSALLQPAIENAAQAAMDWVKDGIGPAMNKWNHLKTPKAIIN